MKMLASYNIGFSHRETDKTAERWVKCQYACLLLVSNHKPCSFVGWYPRLGQPGNNWAI